MGIVETSGDSRQTLERPDACCLPFAFSRQESTNVAHAQFAKGVSQARQSLPRLFAGLKAIEKYF